MVGFLHDLRYASRAIVRMRGLAVVVILTLGVGIAATTTMFSVVYATLFRPVPFNDPERLAMVNVVRTTPRFGTQYVRWSYPETTHLAETLTSFEAVGTFTAAPVNLTDRGQPEQIDAEIASPGYFEALRVTAERGRVFTRDDEQADAPPVALISAGLWRRRYGAAGALVGGRIALNDHPLIVVGVLPERFAGLSGRADVWILPRMAPPITYAGYLTTPQHFINVLGRLRPDRSLAVADAELRAIAARVVVPEPDASAGPSATWGAAAVSLAAARVDARLSRPATVLLAAVLCVLLITCVNVSSLLLARGRARRREVAVRLAMGSGRWRVVRQLLTETTLLALVGGACGLLLTMWAMDLVTSQGWLAVARGGVRQIGAFATPALDAAVWLFAVGISFVTAIACGLVPAIETSRTDLVSALKEDSRTGIGRRHGRVLAACVVCELALAVLLLTVAGLLVRSFVEMQTLRAGFSTEGVVTFWVTPGASRYAVADGPRIVDRLLRQVEQVPGIVAASVNRCTPFDVRCAQTTVVVRDPRSGTETAPVVVGRHYVSAGYFRALGIPLRAGRTIADDDTADRPPVAVINETAARRFWPGESPIGRRVRFGQGTGFADVPQGIEIVGVVGDVKYGPVEDPATADVYTSFRQFTYPETMMIVKTTAPLGAIVPALRAAIAAVDPSLPIYDVRTLDDRIAGWLARPRVTASVIAGFAVSALLLAAFGVYGVMAHSVALRRREIGIHLALGADRARVTRHMLAQGGRYALYGVTIGVAAAGVAARLVGTMLFGVAPGDPVIFVTVVVLIAAVALASALVPARRASAVDPAVVLRSE